MQGPKWTPTQRAAWLAKLVERNRSGRTTFLYEDVAWMTDAYVTRDLTQRQIANEAECSLRTVARWMRTHGIESRKDWQRASGPRNGRWKGATICPVCDGTKDSGAQMCVRCRDRSGERNPKWRGDDADYAAIHYRLVAQRGKPSALECAHCGGPAAEWAYDHTDPDERRNSVTRDDGPYSLDLTRYMPLCVRCHRKFDNGRRALTRTSPRLLKGRTTTAM